MITNNKLFLHMIRIVWSTRCTNLLLAIVENNYSSYSTKFQDLDRFGDQSMNISSHRMLNTGIVKHYTNFLLQALHYKSSNCNTILQDFVMILPVPLPLKDLDTNKLFLRTVHIDNHTDCTNPHLELVHCNYSNCNKNLHRLHPHHHSLLH